MPKLTGPLFSVEARKTLAKAITYQRRPSGASVYGYKKPKIPLTDRQLWQREKIAYCVAAWQDLSDEEKDGWEKKAKGQGQSGYSYFIKQRRGYILDPDLVLYLPFWDTELKGNSFPSRELYQHQCTISGATWGATGRYFDGTDDYSYVPDHASLDFTSSFTVIEWIKSPLGWVGDLVRGIISKSRYVFTAPFQGGYGVYLDKNGVVYFYIATTEGYYQATGIVTISANTWSHVGVVYNSAIPRAKGFLNGVPGSPKTPTLAPTANNFIVNIGADNNASHGRKYKGYIGEVWIYQGAVTDAKMEYIYLATKWRYQ